MDLDKIRRLAQEREKELEKKVLRLCNPQKIAQELIKELEADAAETAKEGGSSAVATFYIWTENGYSGPLIKCPDRDELSEVLFNLVKKYITDDNIELKFHIVTGREAHPVFGIPTQQARIVASVSW